MLVYNIIDIILYFGSKMHSWPFTLFFRILWMLTDIAMLICYSFYASDYYNSAYIRYRAISITCLYGLALCIEISIVVIYSKLPSRNSVCCQPYDDVDQDRNQVQGQGTTQILMPNGQLMQLVPVNQTQPIGNINQACVPNQSNPANNQEANEF